MQRQCKKNKKKDKRQIDKIVEPAEKQVEEYPVVPQSQPVVVEPQKKSLQNEQAIKIIQQVIRERFLKPAEDGAESSNAVSDQLGLLLQMRKKLEKTENVHKKQESHLPVALLSNLKMLMQQTQLPNPMLDESTYSDDEEEYIEYIFQPRNYFLVCLCHHCKKELQVHTSEVCKRCGLVYYCSLQHMQVDRKEHRIFCRALEQVANNNGGAIFRKSGSFSADEFRSYRLVVLRQIESCMDRPLSIEEKEVILFPRLCLNTNCRENDFKKLQDCTKCSQVAFCKDKPDHFKTNHHCEAYVLFKELIMQQHKFGRIEPSVTTKVLKCFPDKCTNSTLLLHKLSLDPANQCENAVLSQLATGPFTAWYSLKLCKESYSDISTFTVHVIGAEFNFEVDYLQKWEYFFLHIVPHIQQLNIVFIGPELHSPGINIEFLTKTKCCLHCRSHSRSVQYEFKCQLYHEYKKDATFIPPQLICFFNAGLYREFGYMFDDTWPETILAAAQANCPMVVTSYTQLEAPLDFMRLLQEANRSVQVVLPPTINPFASSKPERNFISDHEVPLIFKNYYLFVVK